jgi:hypothetical protein
MLKENTMLVKVIKTLQISIDEEEFETLQVGLSDLSTSDSYDRSPYQKAQAGAMLQGLIAGMLNGMAEVENPGEIRNVG